MSNEVQLVKFEHVIHLIKDNIAINDACKWPIWRSCRNNKAYDTLYFLFRSYCGYVARVLHHGVFIYMICTNFWERDVAPW